MGTTDAERFQALFDDHFAAVRRYVHHLGIQAGHADDLVAETFLVAWRRLDDLPQDHERPWLLAVARNVWRNERRRSRRHQDFVRSQPAPPDAPPPGEPGDTVTVREALAALPEGSQEVLRLVAWDGLTIAEAATVLGCSPGAARVRLHRARRQLAKRLARRSTVRPLTEGVAL